ncbi:MAG TPA: choice-of-anchor J domain-containing protein [Candidatus Barnesiella merdipullorum]|nr:choice-of-anchor J domain-containing protein [Candidatus Barnesiella merdipullorum]
MKKLFTFLACATLAISGGYAFQKVTKGEPIRNLSVATMQMQRLSNAAGGEVQGKEIARRNVSKLRMNGHKVELGRKVMNYNQSRNLFDRVLRSNGLVSQAAAAVEVPFLYDFSNAENFADDWTIINANNDDETWEYDSSNGGVSVKYNDDYVTPSDDYLVTKEPISIPAGDGYVRVIFSAFSSSYPENFEVLWGTTSNVDEMEPLAQYESFTGGSAYNEVIDLSVETAGDYYFAFHVYSEANQFGVNLSLVEIGSGEYVEAADISAMAMSMPAPGISLTTGTVDVTFGNACGLDITSFAFEWTLLRDGAEVASGKQSVTETLAPQADVTVQLADELDLSEVGVYELQITATDVVTNGGREESNLANNTISGKTVHFGVSDVPVTADFSAGESPSQWYSDGGWTYIADEGAMVCYYGGSLYSQGLNLKAGSTYRISYTHKAGMNYMGWIQLADNYSLMCSKDGGAFSDIHMVENEYTEENYVAGEVLYECTEDGVYQFAFYQNEMECQSTLMIRDIEVTELLGSDMSVDGIYGMPTMAPVSQSISGNVLVGNKGATPVSGNLVVEFDGSQLASVSVPEIGVGETATVPVEFTITGATAGTTAQLEFTVSIAGATDTNEDNNTQTVSLEVTDGILAFDHTENYTENNTVGMGEGMPMIAAIPIHLTTESIITGISVGWGSADNQDITLAAYKYDPESLTEDDTYGNVYELGQNIFTEVVAQGSEVGQIEYPITPKLLEPGDYMIAVGVSGYCLVVDGVTPGILYLIDSDMIIDQSSANLGTPAIRPIFGEGEVAEIDYTVNAIVSPVGESILASNQPIVVRVTNNSQSEQTATLSVTVNGESAGSQSVTLGRYESNEYTFTADMAEPGSYTIVATVEIEGDENPEDNRVEATVVSAEPRDPYLMDFEGCADFSIDNFNPQWTTYDGDGAPAYGVSGFTFPVPTGGVAFMAFNPYMTTPSLAASAPSLVPTSGERYGITFYTNTGERNDDWLISPKLALPAEGAALTMQVQSFDDQYGLEEYEVCVSTTGNDPADFEVVQSGEAPYDKWEKVTVDLSKYNGQEVHVALHVISSDVFYFMVDDIEITKPGSGIDDAVSATWSLYPNPVSETLVINTAGQEIESVEIYSTTGALIDTLRGTGSECRYNVTTLAPGVYVAKVVTEAGTRSMRFAVK